MRPQLRAALLGSAPAAAAAPAAWSPYAGSAVHLDFINQKYYWSGAEKLISDWTSSTGATFDSNGLIGTGTAADYDIRIPFSAFGVSAPFVMVTVFRTGASIASGSVIINLEATTLPAQNNSRHVLSGGSILQHGTVVSNVSQALQSGPSPAINTIYSMGTLIQTNLFRNSVSGATAGAEDTSGTLPTHVTLRLLESGTAASPFPGHIRHILFFQNSGGSEISQADLNTLTTALAAI